MPQPLPETRQLDRSVTKDGQIVNFFLPYLNNRTGALPPNLPPFTTWGYYSARDLLLMSTLNKEDQWSAAVGLAIDQVVAKGWEIDSEIPTRRKRAQSWLKEAGAGWGLFGFTKFLGVHLMSYLTTGIAYIEIERSSPATGSRVINIHHLNPLQCRLTGDPRFPVNYQGLDGNARPLAWHQVIVIVDKMIQDQGAPRPYGAAERAYNTIRKLANIENFIDEKISGRRPLSINFVGGITRSAINDIMESSQSEATRQGMRSYMGAAIVAVPGDTAVTNVSIPVAELPEITDVARERLRADLIYANAIGLDPQDVNPNLVGRQGMGSTGNQSQILDEKSNGRGLAKWAKEFSNEINQLALDDSTTFTFIENDMRDRKQEAEIRKMETDTQKTQIEAKIITPDQARNLLVDSGALPPEFLEKDTTGADKLRDDQKPETPEEVAQRKIRGGDKVEEVEAGEGETAVKMDHSRDSLRYEMSPQWDEVYH